MLKAWKHQTNQGRVVYERTQHNFLPSRLRAIAKALTKVKIQDVSRGYLEKYLADWFYLAQIALTWYQLSASRMGYFFATEEHSGIFDKNYREIPTPAQYWAARAIYAWDLFQKGVTSVLNKIPYVKDVWTFGSSAIQILIDVLKSKLGAYSYSPAPESLTLF